MGSLERISVSPAVMAWARASSGYEPKVAARRLGVKADILDSWESGKSKPTIKQLRKAAKLYKRPLAVLLLPEPPEDFDALHDFRRPSDITQHLSPTLLSEFRRAISQREVLLELADVAPGAVPDNEFGLSLSLNVTPEDAGNRIREYVGFKTEKVGGRPDPRSVLNTWMTAIEEQGVVVIQSSRVSLQEMRGFSIAEWPFPVIGLNGADSPRGKLFTLLHEIAHLALKAGGLCDLHESRSTQLLEDKTEHYCNRTAAAALMPEIQVLAVQAIQQAQESTEWSLEELHELSSRFAVSSEALLLRLITLKKASWDLYWALKPQIEKRYEEARERARIRQRAQTGGPSYYVIKVRDIGNSYAATVLDAFHSRAISSLDVASYLDIKYDQLPKLEKVVFR